MQSHAFPLLHVQKCFELDRQFRVFLELSQQLLEVCPLILLRRVQLPFHLAHIRVRVKRDLKLLGVDLALLIQDMGIDLSHHLSLGMAGISLSGLDVAMVQLQLIGCAAVAQLVEAENEAILVEAENRM